MKKQMITIGASIIGSAIIWGAAMIGCSMKLKGTDCFGEISTILGGAAGFHLIFIWGPLAAQIRKLKGGE